MRTAALALVLLLVPRVALALQQPNGAAIPSSMGCSGGKPTGLLPTFACACTAPGICNIGAPCASQTSCDNGQHGTCESTMWHSFNDNTCIPSNQSRLDPWTLASTTPETFRPTCALTFTVMSRGTAIFQNVFGWYNVTGQVPDPSDLHVMLGCTDGAGASSVLDLTKEPGYKGGDIGFFLLTPEGHPNTASCAGGDCCPTVSRLQGGVGYAYYSQKEFNPDQSATFPFIHMLVYDSSIFPKRFYFTWEDTFDTTSADFTDLVAAVDGVECSGAGVSCNTGLQGVCAFGVTECAGGGTISCTEVVPPGPDICNGVDDDCDGDIDDGATCPDPSDVCHEGQCVQRCDAGEFKCPANTACDSASGLCVDPSCVGVACPSNQVCSGGACGTACAGVVCPHGQVCLGNSCADLCKNVACPTGQVCRDGACLPGCGECSGVTCAQGLSCDTGSGDCVDPSCPGGCPAGTFCQSGQCVDACSGAKCPANEVCSNGQCAAPGIPGNGPDGGLGSGPGFTEDDGGANGPNGAGPGSTDSAWGSPHSGCACEGAGSGSGFAAGRIALLAAASAFVRRRRRQPTTGASRSGTPSA